MSDTDTTSTVPAVPEAGTTVVKSPYAEHLNTLWKLARLTTHSEMVPRALRGRPDAMLAVMVYGAELRLPPMTALRGIFIIEGTPTCSAKLMRALILRAGHRLEIREATPERAVLYGERADGQGSSLVTWTLDDAKTAGLLGKDVWKRYPRQMLKARATSELARDIFPDIEVGYTPEEMSRVDLAGDYDYLDVDTVDVPTGDDDDDDLDAVLQDDDLDDDDEVDDDTPPAVVDRTLLDAEDAWLAEEDGDDE